MGEDIMTIQPCTNEEEVIEAKSLIQPLELQSSLPEDYMWAVVKDEDIITGVLMWPIDTDMPTDISIAPTLIDNEYPNQNLYWGGF